MAVYYLLVVYFGDVLLGPGSLPGSLPHRHVLLQELLCCGAGPVKLLQVFLKSLGGLQWSPLFLLRTIRMVAPPIFPAGLVAGQ